MDDREQRKVDFAEQLRAAQSRLFGYIHSLVRDLDDADDLFQQTTLILWNKFDDFDRARSFLSWACGVARLEVCNFLRSRGRQRLYFSDDLNLLLAEAQDELAHDEMEERRDALCDGRTTIDIEGKSVDFGGGSQLVGYLGQNRMLTQYWNPFEKIGVCDCKDGRSSSHAAAPTERLSRSAESTAR